MPQSCLRVTLAAVLTVVPLAAWGQSQSLPEEYRFATGLYKQQRWDLAADAFRQFLKKHPNHERVPYARLYLGLTLVNADHLSDARQVLREYVRDYPRSKSLPEALYRVGECSYLLDDLKSAEAEFQQFLKQYPQHELVEWALPYLADTKLRLKQPEAARDLFKRCPRAISQQPPGRGLEIRTGERRRRTSRDRCRLGDLRAACGEQGHRHAGRAVVDESCDDPIPGGQI